jgi:hypothetical protein
MSRKRSQRRMDRHAGADDGLWQRLTAFWVGPVEALPLRIFESLFTVTFLIWMGRCFLTWEDWAILRHGHCWNLGRCRFLEG